jgi:hypothetical protein
MAWKASTALRRAVSTTERMSALRLAADSERNQLVTFRKTTQGRSGAQRLLGAVVGGRNGAVFEEDENASSFQVSGGTYFNFQLLGLSPDFGLRPGFPNWAIKQVSPETQASVTGNPSSIPVRHSSPARSRS